MVKFGKCVMVHPCGTFYMSLLLEMTSSGTTGSIAHLVAHLAYCVCLEFRLNRVFWISAHDLWVINWQKEFVSLRVIQALDGFMI